MKFPTYQVATLYLKNEEGDMKPFEEIELPPPGVARYAALYKYTPRGGSIYNLTEDKIGLFSSEGHLIGIIE